MSQRRSNFNQSGFSLVELLIVIAVIGVMAAIAVPNISSITSHAYYAKTERNAQNVAMVAASARAAGATNSWTTIEDALTDLGNGVHVHVGNETLEFRVPLSDADKTDLASVLRMDDGRVVYEPNGSAN